MRVAPGSALGVLADARTRVTHEMRWWNALHASERRWTCVYVEVRAEGRASRRDTLTQPLPLQAEETSQASASASSRVTVFQLRAVAATPSRALPTFAASLERPTPSGQRRKISRPMRRNSSGA